MHEEIMPLLDILDFTQLGQIVDPWSGTGTVCKSLATKNISVITNDIDESCKADTHLDALHPSYYTLAMRTVGLDAIITSPWFAMLDLAVPLAANAVNSVACVHVPGHYVTDAPQRRADYMVRLMQAGRLLIIFNLPKGPLGRRCAWLVIFATAAMKEALTKSENRVAAPFMYA